MLHTVDLVDYAGAHVANDPTGRGFLLCLHFTSAEAAAQAQMSIQPSAPPLAIAPIVGAPMPVVPAVPPPLKPGEVTVDEGTMVVTRAGAGMEKLIGTKAVRRPDGTLGPAPKQPADLPKLPDGVDASTQAFVDSLHTGNVPDPVVPPEHAMTPSEAQAALAGVGAVSQPHQPTLDQYLGSPTAPEPKVE